MNAFLPKDKVYISELDIWGVVIGVYLSVGGTEYKIRYFKDEVPYETYFFDFEISSGKNSSVNA